MRNFTSGLISFGIGSGLLLTQNVSAVNPVVKKDFQKPNVIFILADDLGYGDLSCYGQSKFKTPNIDQLAASGIRFTNFYSGCTVCAPSRSALMTGFHTGHTYIRGNKGMQPEGEEPLPSGVFTVAELFKEAHYATGAFGKWGLGGPGSEGVPEKQGFDEFFGFNSQSLAHNYYPEYLWHNSEKIFLEGNKNVGKAQYAHDEYHNMALQFIEKHKDEPFFLFCPYIIPHAELSAPDDSLFQKFAGLFPEIPYAGTDNGPLYRKGGYGSQAKPRATFAAMVSRLDRSVGEIIAKLKQLGIEKNTLVIFTSDNGPHIEGGATPDFFQSAGPLRGFKRSLYEGGIRVPFIANWPGVIPSGKRSDYPAAFWDFLPTAAELAGIRYLLPTDGISMVPVLTGKGIQKEHDFLYWEFHEGGTKQAVRMGNWKAVRFGTKEPLELYDLSKDIHEDRNIAAQNPEIIAKIERFLKNARSESTIWQAKEYWPVKKEKN
jgi:arylsulfatase A-like enzyme